MLFRSHGFLYPFGQLVNFERTRQVEQSFRSLDAYSKNAGIQLKGKKSHGWPLNKSYNYRIISNFMQIRKSKMQFWHTHDRLRCKRPKSTCIQDIRCRNPRGIRHAHPRFKNLLINISLDPGKNFQYLFLKRLNSLINKMSQIF